MSEPREFDCIDCGQHVVQIIENHANDDDVCIECLWLRGIKDPAEREAAREFLRRREAQ